MALDTQINILSVDTGNFYYDDETALHERNQYVRTERRKLINGYDEQLEDKTKVHHDGTTQIINKLSMYDFAESDLNKAYRNRDNFSFDGLPEEVCRLIQLYFERMDAIKTYAQEAKETKNKLLDILKQRTEENIKRDNDGAAPELRVLREETIKNEDGNILDKNIISVFDSSFTRMIGAQPDTLTEDFMVVQVYYFDVIKDLIYHGFIYKGEKYIYFTSSAGQIRTKKTVFIKENIWHKYEKVIMCGLTIKSINEKGGNNPNKHLAYMALANSATDVWEDFDIDKTIVIDDFETQVFGTYDLVDDADYSIKRVSDRIPITHTDGAGMMLPCMGRNRMVRLPWVKGLLGVFDFVKFLQVNQCSPVIKDIYGKEHDVIAEGIQIIFTKSQFKMYKYYESWEQYKSLYKQYGCVAGYTNIEEDKIRNATINYQMLQSLTDITDEEIAAISNESINKLKNICSSVDDVKDAFGATVYNKYKTALQKAICLYPELLNDTYIRIHLKDIKDSMVKKYKAGKLRVFGKYTFLLPDYYAACQFWFQHIENPVGLLENGEVFCWLFRKNQKLDVLRSPHLYREHAIRQNVAYYQNSRQAQLREWFCTDAIYTSCHDLISKILQFDVDGDKALVVADRTFVAIAERNMQGIVPLYYNMRKAEPSLLSNKTIYDGLSMAFTGSNIGQYSNNITKIWNSDVFIHGTEEEKQSALDVIKLLCMENNFRIDFAKTLYMPERPPYIKELITSMTNCNVPFFFKYAKDKEDYQVSEINESFVNKIGGIIPNPRINCKYVKGDNRGKRLGKPDYKLMMCNPELEIVDNYLPVINKYLELSRKYYFRLDNISIGNYSGEVLMRSQIRQNLICQRAVSDIKKELSAFGYDDCLVSDILVKYLYGEKDSKFKDVLWNCYGEIIYDNLSKRLKPTTKEIQCVDCGEWFEVSKFDSMTCRCKNCQAEIDRENARLRKIRQRNRNVTLPSETQK